MAAVTRRRFVQSAALAGAAPAAILGRAADAPPNVLFVTADQMRGDCIASLGHPNARTPNIDRMAREGVLFANGFASGPVCVPTRKSCFSGLHPHEHGSLTNDDGEKLDFKGTLLDYFARRGYRTGWIGKNHTYAGGALRNLDKADIRSREPFRAYNGYVPPHWHGDVYWPEEDCFPHVNTESAIAFLKEGSGGDPFFLHVSYFDPHPPYMAPARYSARYASADMALPDPVPPAALSARLDRFSRAMGFDRLSREDLTETMRYYYAQIEWGVDRPLGRLLRALETQGLSDGTIVVLTADHGDFMGDYGMVRKGMFLYDSLLRVPMIWRAPGRIAEGLRPQSPMQSVDFFPTLAELTGGGMPAGLSGRSMAAHLRGEVEDGPDHAIFTSAAYGDLAEGVLPADMAPDDIAAKPRHTRVLGPTMRPMHRTKMARAGEWKLILNETEAPELYRIGGSPAERRNAAAASEHAAVRKRLESRLERWWRW